MYLRFTPFLICLSLSPAQVRPPADAKQQPPTPPADSTFRLKVN
jgi:hypothetical protein